MCSVRTNGVFTHLPPRALPKPPSSESHRWERGVRKEQRAAIAIPVQPAAISPEYRNLLANVRIAFEGKSRRLQGVFGQAILDAPQKEKRELMHLYEQSKLQLWCQHQAIDEYIRGHLDRLTAAAVRKLSHAVVISKAESGLKNTLRWIVTPDPDSSEVRKVRCIITLGVLGGGGEAIVKEIMVCSTISARWLAMRQLRKTAKHPRPNIFVPGQPPSPQEHLMQLVQELTKRGVPRLVPMEHWLYPGKHDEIKQAVVMPCYYCYQDVILVTAMTETARVTRIRVAALLAETVWRMHHAGMVHLDLKPDNVFLNDVGLPYLGDFGFARDIGADSGTQGTIGWRPPEVLRAFGGGVIPANPKIDLWSFGALLYFSFLRVNPFKAIQEAHFAAVASGNEFLARD